MTWIIAAVFSAVFAGLTSILAKCGIKKTDSDLATALRTIVVLAFSWLMVFVVGSQTTIVDIQPKALIFLILSGFATGASWICYFKALSMGDINKVVPIDKSSTILTVLLAIICFGETSNLVVKLIATAILAAVFAALTSILAKVGISGVESNLGTAIRTGVVLVLSWGIVFARKKHTGLRSIDKKELLFICLSGIATGASWLCYYYAIGHGDVSVVVPIDKLSILVTVTFSYIVFKEKLSKKAFLGLALMVAGTLLMAFFK